MKNFIEISFIKNKYPKLFRIILFLPGLASITIISVTAGGYFFYLQWYYNDIILTIWLLIIAYYLRWIIRWLEYISFILYALFKIKKFEKINFEKILKWEYTNLEEKKLIKKMKENQENLNAYEIVHRCLIPTYKESESILQDTLSNLVKSNFDKNKIAVTICWEEADKENFLKIIQNLEKKFKNKFWFFNYTIHPKWIPWEIPWKWANIKYAAKQTYQKILKHFNTTPEKVLVTTLDADTNVDKEYFNILTYTYLSTPNKKYKSYQPLIFFFNNFWDAPFFSKAVSLGNSYWILFNTTKNKWLRNFSTHAQPLDALIELDFWSNETIVEDWHQYRRSYFGFYWNHECVPVYTKVYQDANLNKNILLTAKAQYNQMRRWAHWAEDISYSVCQRIYNFKQLNFRRTLYEVLRLTEGHIMWASLHFVLSIWFWLTLIKDIKFFSQNSLGKVLSIFLGISLIFLLLTTILNILLSPWYKLSKKEKIIEFLKFITLYPIFIWPILVIFSGLPALHTQIMLMLGKPMKKFNVTIKVRKNESI